VSATLLDEGQYLCHWRTMYRLLCADAATFERRAVRRHPVSTRPELLATAPRQVWSWDITKLRGPLPGVWYSLYVVLDIFSRMVVGWLLATHEDVRTLWVAGGAGPGQCLPAGGHCAGPVHDPCGPGRPHDREGRR
jgi:transposase InsO family protein